MATRIGSLAERLTAIKTGDGTYASKHVPLKAGNALPIAYGGFSIGFAINAATDSVPEGRQLYSVLGQFLGPVSIERKVTCKVISHRETRTFSSRRVEVYQEQDKGPERLCMLLLTDFKTLDTPMLEYSTKPTRQYSAHEKCPPTSKVADRLLAAGEVTQEDVTRFYIFFGPLQEYFETRQCPEGVSAQNLTGIAKKLKTTQEGLPIADKTSAEWVRCHETQIPAQSRFGNVGFLMDAGLSFLPLVQEHYFLTDAGACSSLDFAIRIFDPEPDTSQWHLRERRTIVGKGGLTYSEGRLFDQHERLVASMTQQSILRPKPAKKSDASKQRAAL